MTEDEAKTKACCGSGDRPAMNGPCIASARMAWRKGPGKLGAVVERVRAIPGSQVPGPNWGYEASHPSSASKGGDWVLRKEIATGFCGLAGQP